jgi:hypothetical protein
MDCSILGFDPSMNGSFRWIALETARLQRTSALRLCRSSPKQALVV